MFSPLERRLGLWQATALNVANMVGVGPFITIPLFIAAMNGPQALVAWVAAAVLVLCDGLVWSELGAALPGSGGTYHFLKEIFGGHRLGRLLPFLFIWQFLLSGALELASGYLGGVMYLQYALPGLNEALTAWGVPRAPSVLAAAGAITVTALLCRPIDWLGRVAVLLCTGTIITVLVVIVCGLANFRPELLTFPPDALAWNAKTMHGLGAAMLIAIYDYLGYYNICHLGDEVREPGRTIPRAVILSVLAVATIYLTMNISIIGVVPWQEAMASQNIAATFMERLYGRPAAVALSVLILWTVAACVFAMTLGYSRIPLAAARGGDFFRVFGRVHPTGHYPTVSLAAIGLLTAGCCFFLLGDVVTAAVTVRILVQFIGQIVALHVLRTRRPDVVLPFRMWLYPLPSLMALAGWLFVLGMAEAKFWLGALGVIVSGCAAFAIWNWRERRAS